MTLLHAEYHRPAEKPVAGRLSRHYFDDVRLMELDCLYADVIVERWRILTAKEATRLSAADPSIAERTAREGDQDSEYRECVQTK